MTIKIQSGIPLPPKMRGKKSNLEKLKSMRPYDAKPVQSFKVSKKEYPCVYQLAQRAGIKITARFNGTAVRIWKLS